MEPEEPRRPGDAAPDSASAADIHARLRQAVALHNGGQLAEAEALYYAFLAIHPDHFAALHLLGLVRYQRGEPAEALRHIDRAIAVNPNVAVAHNHRGVALKDLNRWDEALASYDTAVALDPGDAVAHYNRGNLLRELGRLEAAVSAYERAMALAPDNVDAVNNRGTALRALKRFDDALASYDRAIALAPDRADVHYNRGNVLIDLGRFEEALASADRAIATNPGLAEAFNLRGNVLLDLRRFDEAIASYDQAIAISPGYADAFSNRAICRLLIGRHAEGWADHEWRWMTGQLARERRNFAQPQWDGRADIAGKTILLHAEQGFGDTLMAVRFVRRVVARGAGVIVEIPAALQPLLAEIEGAVQVVAKGQALPAFDLHCPLMSLPFAFQTTLSTIPADIPYLSVPKDYAEKWRQRLPKGRIARIGVLWAGSPDFKRDRERSIRLRQMLPILLRADAEYVSLQRDLREGDAETLRAHPRILHLGDAIDSFADTAAIISRLDLIISVDTSVVHLAGGLGRPVWVLLPFLPDWRWLLDRNDSPWYPTARLFRQTQRNNWSLVISDVGRALTAFLAEKPKALRSR
jgi:tetratricopeptide (TPR) repeat protein